LAFELGDLAFAFVGGVHVCGLCMEVSSRGWL
jgi:hypothetical protein